MQGNSTTASLQDYITALQAAAAESAAAPHPFSTGPVNTTDVSNNSTSNSDFINGIKFQAGAVPSNVSSIIGGTSDVLLAAK